MLGQLTFEALQQTEERLRNRISANIIRNSEANIVVLKYHYLHRKRTGGQQLSYGIFLDGKMVGTLIYASPTFHHKRGLIPPLEQGEVIELARMWLDDEAPKHSETCAIGKTLRQVRVDWQKKYDVEPKAVISFSDLEFGYEGTVYKAANFINYGFAPEARLADSGATYSRTSEGWGAGHYKRLPIQSSAVRVGNTKQIWLYFWDKDVREQVNIEEKQEAKMKQEEKVEQAKKG